MVGSGVGEYPPREDWVPPYKADRKIKKLTIKREGGKGGRSQIKEGN